MIALLTMLTVPPPPEPVTRKTGLPEYVADCLLVGTQGQAVELRARVQGQVPSRKVLFSTNASELGSLDGLEVPAVGGSVVGWKKLWETWDSVEAVVSSQPVTIKLIVEDDLGRGAGIHIQERGQVGVPLYSGMCRAKSNEVSSSK